MSVNSLQDPGLVFALEPSARRGRRALLSALALLLCLTVPAWAFTPQQSDKDALARIKRANDTHNQLTGASWISSLAIYDNSKTVIWSRATPARASSLHVGGKELTGNLDATGLDALAGLHAPRNQLTGLDVSRNDRLKSLDVSDNQLTGLDLSKNISLTRLYAPRNQLSSLDVGNNMALMTLDVSGNRLGSLDLTGLDNLHHLGIAETGLKLSDLHLPSYGQLWSLELDPAQLAQQDFSVLTKLYELHIYDSEATELSLQLNSTLPPRQIGSLTITAPRAASLDFSNYTLNLKSFSIGSGRLEHVSGAAGLDQIKFYGLTINNNRLPLSQLKSLASAVNLKLPSATITAAIQSQVWFESLVSRNKPFDLSAQLAPEWTLEGQTTKFELLPASAVTTDSDGAISVNRFLALKQGHDYTLSPDGSLKIAQTGQYYLLMSNPALYNWEEGAKIDEMLALSGLLDYQGQP